MSRTAAAAHYCCILSLTALIFLGLAWELQLAPARSGGSLLAFKVLPLLLLGWLVLKAVQWLTRNGDPADEVI